MGINDDLIKEIAKRVLKASPVNRIILFGSAATGEMDEDSDVDLLILKSNLTNPFKESVQIGNALRGLGFPFDVIVMAQARFEETKNVIGGIAYPAHKYGKVIYEAGG